MSLGQAVRAGRVQCEECNPLDGYVLVCRMSLVLTINIQNKSRYLRSCQSSSLSDTLNHKPTSIMYHEALSPTLRVLEIRGLSA